MIPAGRRWFVVRDRGVPVALGALLVLEGSATSTMSSPSPRREGAGSRPRWSRERWLQLATRAPSAPTCSPSPTAPRSTLYERLGFRPLTQIASWISPDRLSTAPPAVDRRASERAVARRSRGDGSTIRSKSAAGAPWPPRPPPRGCASRSSRIPRQSGATLTATSSVSGSSPRPIAWATRRIAVSASARSRSRSWSSAKGG